MINSDAGSLAREPALQYRCTGGCREDPTIEVMEAPLGLCADRRPQLAGLLVSSSPHQLGPAVSAVIHVTHLALLFLQR